MLAIANLNEMFSFVTVLKSQHKGAFETKAGF